VSYLTIKSVVDAVNDVVSRWLLGSEAALVFLDQFLLLSSKSRNVVDLTDSGIRSVGRNLSGHGGVHALHLQVDTHVGVVDINNAGSSQKSNVFVITDSVGRRCKGSHASSDSKCRKELTTGFRHQLSAGSSGLGSHKSSSRAVEEGERGRGEDGHMGN